jgi:hypothetical protein
MKMKSLLKVLCAALMLTLASCAHHGKDCHDDKCKMEKGSKECQECCKSGKCDMSKEAAPATEVKAEETKTEAPAGPAETKPATKKKKAKK